MKIVPISFRCLPACLVGTLLLTLLGCTYGISVRRADGPDVMRSWRANVGKRDELSPRTHQTLYRWDLETAYRRKPLETYQQLQKEVASHPEPDLLFALAEISHLFGRKAEKQNRLHACGFYYLCAGYAYHYLFPCPLAQAKARSVNPDHGDGGRYACGPGAFDEFAFDPRFRLACDLYNTGLSKCIDAAQRVGRLDPRQQLHLPTSDGQGFTLTVDHHGFPWRPEEFGPLLLCADYEVVGLTNHYRGYGLGVSLIGIRHPEIQARDSAAAWADKHARARSAEHDIPQPLSPLDPKAAPPTRLPDPAPNAGRFPHEVSFPVTAFFRFEGTAADLISQRAGRLELYNPLAIQTVHIQSREVPLETDLTTPLAYFLSRTDLEGIEYTGLLAADKIQERSGIYMFEPYQPGKIPVVMVHGLLGSPLTWTTMFNDFRADPELRKKYQFWFYLYPTGKPYLSTAADLRQELSQLRGQLDPRGEDASLDHMVLVGHSMGGLIGRLMVTDSGDDFWKLVSDRSLDDLKISPNTRNELRRVFYFRDQSCVEREIFITTPHHGSKLSPSPPIRLLAKFIRMPSRMMAVAGELGNAEPTLLGRARETQFASSIDLLAPGSPALELLAARSHSRRVHFHSIIGAAFGQGEASSDGVVPYKSAHLDGVDSELLVPASHMAIQHHPRAVMEVRRIVLLHLQEVQKRDGVVPIPTNWEPDGNPTSQPPRSRSLPAQR